LMCLVRFSSVIVSWVSVSSRRVGYKLVCAWRVGKGGIGGLVPLIKDHKCPEGA
jgi:hypothetical protein